MIHTLITTVVAGCFYLFGLHREAAWLVAVFYIGREHAQAEYRTIYKNYGNRRDIAPWWCGFESRSWSAKSLLDFLGPCVIAIIASFI